MTYKDLKTAIAATVEAATIHGETRGIWMDQRGRFYGRFPNTIMPPAPGDLLVAVVRWRGTLVVPVVEYKI